MWIPHQGLPLKPKFHPPTVCRFLTLNHIPTDKTQDCCIGCCKHLYSWPYILVIKALVYPLIFSYEICYHLVLWMWNCLLLLDIFVVFELFFAEFGWFGPCFIIFTVFYLLVISIFTFIQKHLLVRCGSFVFHFMPSSCLDYVLILRVQKYFVSFHYNLIWIFLTKMLQ